MSDQIPAPKIPLEECPFCKGTGCNPYGPGPCPACMGTGKRG